MPIWTYSNPPELPPPELRNLPPVGRCIYCPCKKNLTTEHVMPAGMKGRVTLPRATCDECRTITRDLETLSMRKTMLHARIKHELHQHPKEKPTKYPVKFIDWHDNEITKMVPLEDVPILTIMHVLEYPGILRNVPAEQTKFGLLHIHHAEHANYLFQKLLSRPGVKSVTVSSQGIEAWKFARWLAKIAFSFSVACLGYEAVSHSPLREIIKNGTTHFNYFIGGDNELRLLSQEFRLEPKTDEFFRVELSDAASSDGRIFWTVRLRLLPKIMTPTYLIVVAERL